MKKTVIAIMAMLFLLAPLAAQRITVVSPNGGETLTLGNSFPIAWTATGVSQNVKIILMRPDNSIYGRIIEGLSPGSSPYNWTVGALQGGTADAGTYKVRVITLDGATADVSDGTFTLVAGGSPEPEPPAAFPVTVTSPHGGETWLKGTTYDVTWNAGGLTGSADLRLYFGASGTGSFTRMQSISLPDGRLRWEADNMLMPTDARNQDAGYFYRLGITQGSGNPVAFSGAFHIVAPTGHDFVISDPYLEQRSSGKGFRVKVTDRNSDFEGWVVVSHYCMGMGLGNAVKERRRLELRQGVPVTVNLANLRGSLFDGKCDVLFRFDVNPDHAVEEINYGNNTTTKKFCWESGHDGRFFALRLGKHFTKACENCAVVIQPGDVDIVDATHVSVRLEITLQNCGMTAIRNGSLLINESWNGGRSARSVVEIKGIDIEPGHYQLINQTVPLERHSNNGLNFHFICGETGTLNANNRFACSLNYIGF